MTVRATIRKAKFRGDGSTESLLFDFKVFSADDLVVILSDADGGERTLQRGSDYTVALNVDQERSPGGSVVFAKAPKLGETITVLTDEAAMQLAEPTNSGRFAPETLERQLDYLTVLAQKHEERLRRSLKTSPSDTDELGALPSATQRAGKFIAFDVSGQPLASSGTGADAGLREDLAGATTGSEGARLVANKYAKPGAAAVHLHDYIEDNGAYNVMGFIPQNLKSAIRNHTSNDDLTTYLQDAMSACGAEGRVLFLPRGRFNVASTLTTQKPDRLWIRGERATYFANAGTVLRWVGSSGFVIEAGVADGNPDVTGKTLDFRLSDIALEQAGTGSDGAVKIVNTAFGWLKRVMTRFFPGKVVYLQGGNVLSVIEDCEISGAGDAVGNCGIYLDDYQFGNFVTHIRRNHVYALKYAMRFAEGRYLNVHDNTVEGIHGDVYVFETDGWISHARFHRNYHEEAAPGWTFGGGNFRGLILKLTVTDNEFWGHTNGPTGFGNLDKNRVLEHELRGNWIATAGRNSVGGLAMPAVYPSTELFVRESSIANCERTNAEYIDNLTLELLRGDRELLGLAGDFNSLAGATLTLDTGTPAVYWSGTSGCAPYGWHPGSEAGRREWRVEMSPGLGWQVTCTSAGAAIVLAEKTIPLPGGPLPRARWFAIAFTFMGWGALQAQIDSGTPGVIFDHGQSANTPQTFVIKLEVPANATIVKLLLLRKRGNFMTPIELRMWEIGSSEYNARGVAALGNALAVAVSRVLKKRWHGGTLPWALNQ